MGPRKQSTGTTENTSASAEDRMLASDVAMHVEVALVKKDVENLQKDVTGIKSKMVEKEDLAQVEKKVEKIENNSSWLVRLIGGALLLQIVYWIAKGGLNVPIRIP